MIDTYTEEQMRKAFTENDEQSFDGFMSLLQKPKVEFAEGEVFYAESAAKPGFVISGEQYYLRWNPSAMKLTGRERKLTLPELPPEVRALRDAMEQAVEGQYPLNPVSDFDSCLYHLRSALAAFNGAISDD